MLLLGGNARVTGKKKKLKSLSGGETTYDAVSMKTPTYLTSFFYIYIFIKRPTCG